ncbi:MAG: 30S ribosomal protein S8 [bacterium]|nr:30S ribosomal protein S8 [bacterium]
MDYQIGDFLIRIKNASLAKRRSAEVTFSKVNKAIGKILVKEGFLRDMKDETKDGKKILVAQIMYEKRIPVFNDVLLISKPSLRVYSKAKNIQRRRLGLGVSVVSTSQGIMTEQEARKKGVGGELLFRVW